MAVKPQRGSGRSALGRSRRYLRVLPVKRGRPFHEAHRVLVSAAMLSRGLERPAEQTRPYEKADPLPAPWPSGRCGRGRAAPGPRHATAAGRGGAAGGRGERSRCRGQGIVGSALGMTSACSPFHAAITNFRGAAVDARSALSVRPAHRAGARRRPRPGRRRRRRIRALVPWRRRRNRDGRAGRHRRSCLRSPRGRHRR
jgi:hypothetical protein